MRTDLEYSARCGHERNFADLILKRSQQFLRHPRGPQHPAALGAVANLDARACSIHLAVFFFFLPPKT